MIGNSAGHAGERAIPPYRPRHAMPDRYQELFDAFDSLQEAEQTEKSYVPKHLAPEDDPYSTAYYIPVSDLDDPDIDAGLVSDWMPAPESDEGQPPCQHGGDADGGPEALEDVTDEPDAGGLSLRIRPVTPPESSNPVPGMELVPEAEGQPLDANPAQRRGLLRRAADAWRNFNARTATFFYDPERGRRRRLAIIAIGAIAIGTGAWLIGHYAHEHIQPPQSPPDALPPPSPPGPEVVPPPQDTCAPQCPHDPALPQYKGQSYEWNLAADSYGPADATPHILRMIDAARAHDGVRVNTWGDPASGHWGISSIAVDTRDGGHRIYYDTPRKWAILEYLSRLHRRMYEENDEDDDMFG